MLIRAPASAEPGVLVFLSKSAVTRPQSTFSAIAKLPRSHPAAESKHALDTHGEFVAPKETSLAKSATPACTCNTAGICATSSAKSLQKPNVPSAAEFVKPYQNEVNGSIVEENGYQLAPSVTLVA